MHDVQDAGWSAIVECFMIATLEIFLAAMQVAELRSHLVQLRPAIQYPRAMPKQNLCAMGNQQIQFRMQVRSCHVQKMLSQTFGLLLVHETPHSNKPKSNFQQLYLLRSKIAHAPINLLLLRKV